MSRLGTYLPRLRSTLQSGYCSLSDLSTWSARSHMTLPMANPRHSQGWEWETIIPRKVTSISQERELAKMESTAIFNSMKKVKYTCSVEPRKSSSLAPRLMPLREPQEVRLIQDCQHFFLEHRPLSPMANVTHDNPDIIQGLTATFHAITTTQKTMLSASGRLRS